ncbi:MAG: DUF1585 domain-containing protein, partial [Bryobacterales bacterium]|nr:DUF1585 domain-containing protein [Bryobacterales bacterium]
PADESKMELPLRQMLEKHRANPSCAGCHARFDSFGLAFEAFDPTGRRRTHDLAGRAVDARAAFPGGVEGEDVTGLRDYIRQRRQHDFVRGFVRKMLAYGLGRSLTLPDDVLIEDITRKLGADGCCFATVVDNIVTSRQFLNKR